MIVQYKIIVDTQDRSHPTKNKKTYLLNIDELLTDGTDSDKLVITKDNDYVLRYFKASEFNVMSKLDTPYKEPIDIDININLFEGTNFVYIENITGEDIYAEYIIKNDFTDVYVTKNTMNSTISESIDKIELSISQKLTNYSTTEEMNSAITLKADEITSSVNKKLENYDTSSEVNSKIEQKAGSITSSVSETYSTKQELKKAKSEIKQTTDSITSTVSKKVGNDELISKINQSADRITLSAGRLVINSGNFILDENGNVKCTNGEFQGNITLIAGNDISIHGKNNMKNMSLDYSGLVFYDYNNNVTATITRTYYSSKNLYGASVYIKDNSYFSINKYIGNTQYQLMRFDDINGTPYIRNTANGTLFSNNSLGGVKIENGLITNWGINSTTCDLNNVTITGIKVSNGLIESITYQSN